MSNFPINPFDIALQPDLGASTQSMSRQYPVGTMWLIDGPGIGRRIGNKSATTHIAAGGSFLHQINPDGTLEHPEHMWPGKGLEGKQVTLDGNVLSA